MKYAQAIGTRRGPAMGCGCPLRAALRSHSSLPPVHHPEGRQLSHSDPTRARRAAGAATSRGWPHGTAAPGGAARGSAHARHRSSLHGRSQTARSGEGAAAHHRTAAASAGGTTSGLITSPRTTGRSDGCPEVSHGGVELPLGTLPRYAIVCRHQHGCAPGNADGDALQAGGLESHLRSARGGRP